MAARDGRAGSLKERARLELLEYLAISLYLCVYLGALLNYRRSVLSEMGISYTHYGYAVIESLILAKVILIGEAMHIGRREASRRLAVSALYQSIVFGIFVLAFQVLERAIHALVTRAPVAAEVAAMFRRPSATLAHVLVLILAFVPFFLLREAGRQLGEERLFGLLLRRPRSEGRTPDDGGKSRGS
jgi:hypothetical protein